jgi:hypothetical protein
MSITLPNQTSSGDLCTPCTTSADATLAVLECACGGLTSATDAPATTLHVSPWLISGPQSRIVSAWAAVVAPTAAVEAAVSSTVSTLGIAAAVEISASRPQSGSTTGSSLSFSSLPTADEHDVPLMAPRRADDSKLHARTHSDSSSSHALSAKPTLFKVNVASFRYIYLVSDEFHASCSGYAGECAIVIVPPGYLSFGTH